MCLLHYFCHSPLLRKYIIVILLPFLIQLHNASFAIQCNTIRSCLSIKPQISTHIVAKIIRITNQKCLHNNKQFFTCNKTNTQHQYLTGCTFNCATRVQVSKSTYVSLRLLLFIAISLRLLTLTSARDRFEGLTAVTCPKYGGLKLGIISSVSET